MVETELVNSEGLRVKVGLLDPARPPASLAPPLELAEEDGPTLPPDAEAAVNEPLLPKELVADEGF